MFLDCISCSSQSDVNCKLKPEDVRTYCASETCFGRNNPTTDLYTRGCLNAEEVPGCIADENCFICKDAQHCNKKQSTVLECFQCEGETCLEVDSATQTRQKCKEGSKCLTQINSNGQVVRRCTESAEEKCADEKTCSICEGQLCNGNVFPADRLRCLQCDSATAGDECSLSNGKFLKTCNTYNKDDQCFTFVDDKVLLHRGCVSDNNAGCKGDNCVKCWGDNCNNLGLAVPNTLKCVKCDSSKDAGCESGEVTVAPATCTGTHNLNERETCFVHRVTSADNKITVKRGCYFELPVTDKIACDSSASCHKCGVDGCNKIDDFSESLGFKCYVCDSSSNKDCEKENVPGSTPQVCAITPNSFNEGPGCFVQRRDKDSVIRDCKTSVTSHGTKLDTCSVNTEEKGKDCIVCDGDSCNKMGAPGSATSIKVSSSLIALLSVFLVKYL